MHIDKTGSDVTPFSSLFLDGNGESFRLALSKSFSFASYVVQTAQKTAPDHKLELWDQAVQYRLAKTARLERPFAAGATLHLEKEDSQMVWEYGISITEPQIKGQRLWVLPDGIIKTPDQVIALELDHGRNVGKWGNQLVKALRSLASTQIHGVLYCFCLEIDLHPSGHLLDPTDGFTAQFQKLLEANLFGKSLGTVTISPFEWQGRTNEECEAIDFFDNAYVRNKRMSRKSREAAKRILETIRGPADGAHG